MRYLFLLLMGVLLAGCTGQSYFPFSMYPQTPEFGPGYAPQHQQPSAPAFAQQGPISSEIAATPAYPEYSVAQYTPAPQYVPVPPPYPQYGAAPANVPQYTDAIPPTSP
jgi:hypothetical protein